MAFQRVTCKNIGNETKERNPECKPSMIIEFKDCGNSENCPSGYPYFNLVSTFSNSLSNLKFLNVLPYSLVKLLGRISGIF